MSSAQRKCRVAALLTCHNRKALTLACLESLFEAERSYASAIDLKVFLVDDGSTDGTAGAIEERFSHVRIIPGTGGLFWAGGMRLAWNTARSEVFDYYLLLNDDTRVFPNLFDELFAAQKYSHDTWGQEGIIVGSTMDPATGELSYGGAVITNRFWIKYSFLPPDGSFQSCDLGNANIMFVHSRVVAKIGILPLGYIHYGADYDYTLLAVKKKIPVVVAPAFLGYCIDDHPDRYDKFKQMSLRERIKFYFSPKGFAFDDHLRLRYRHFPFRLPFVIASVFIKILTGKLNLIKRK